jgi:hypothetical protein
MPEFPKRKHFHKPIQTGNVTIYGLKDWYSMPGRSSILFFVIRPDMRSDQLPTLAKK